MKFFSTDSQVMFLSRRGALPPPLKSFDVFYTGYPQIGFTVVGSSSTYMVAPPTFFEPDQFEQQEQTIATDDYLVSQIAQYGSQRGDMDDDLP